MKIVVATDGSSVAKRGLLEALDFGTHLREAPEIHVVAVVDHIMPPAGLGKAPAGAPDLLASEAETALAAAEEIAAGKGVAVTTHLLKGHVGPQILGFADSIQADLIVVGTHGRRGLARAVLGSACEEIVRESRVPVLTVHAAAP